MSLSSVLKKIKHIGFNSYIKVKRIIRNVKKQPTIHVIGDSHSLAFQHESFIIHHIGPATSYKLNSSTSTTKSKEKIYKIIQEISRDKNATILFIFGEIDCRIHINKASKKFGISLEKSIENTVKEYEKFLQQMKKDFPKNTILVLNVLPAGEEKNIYKVKYYPSRKLHMQIVRKFNNSLDKFCKKEKIFFINVFDQLLDENDKRVKAYTFDAIHYNKKILPFIVNEINIRLSN